MIVTASRSMATATPTSSFPNPSVLLLPKVTLLLFLWLQPLLLNSGGVALVHAIIPEPERLAAYHARNYTWPPHQWVPSTLAALMERRIQQIEAIEDPHTRYQAYIVLSSMPGIVGKNLTKYGWAMTRAPAHLVQALTTELHKQPWTIVEAAQNLQPMGLRCMGEPPFMVNTARVNQMILEDLKDLHQQWVSTKLIPTTAYGMRVYRNQSQLLMHIDNAKTHIVSSILHIGSSDDAQEWPLVLQDYAGNTVEVHLQPGDLLLYESSRILHGRPTVFHGSWYTSLFIHYMPVGYWKPGVDGMAEMEYAIPPDWSKPAVPLEAFTSVSNPNSTGVNPLPAISMLGMGVEEAACGGWCDGIHGNRLVLRGPARGEGILETAGGLIFLPKTQHLEDDDTDDEEDGEYDDDDDGFSDEF